MSATASPCRSPAGRPFRAPGVVALFGPRTRCLASAVLLVACGEVPSLARDGAATAGTVDSTAPSTAARVAAGAATTDRPGAPSSPGAPVPTLSPLADTVAQRLVFLPVSEEWFTAAARARRLVVDLGRIDLDVSKDSARLTALREAAAATSPWPAGTIVQLRGPWGADRATIDGFDAWNGRIVATLSGAPRVDSLAREVDPLVAAVRRTAEALPAAHALASPECRQPPDPGWRARLAALARTTEDSMRASDDQPIYARLRANVRARRSMTTGCFGAARAVVIVTLYAGDYEWVRERVLLVGDAKVARATVRDLRFRAHEALHALDADGDGVDDLAARAWTPRGGGTVILRLAEGSRFERLASGFAWER